MYPSSKRPFIFSEIKVDCPSIYVALALFHPQLPGHAHGKTNPARTSTRNFQSHKRERIIICAPPRLLLPSSNSPTGFPAGERLSRRSEGELSLLPSLHYWKAAVEEWKPPCWAEQSCSSQKCGFTSKCLPWQWFTHLELKFCAYYFLQFTQVRPEIFN